jgi:hypothetical protein
MLFNQHNPNTHADRIGKPGFVKMTKTEKVCHLFNSAEELLSRKSKGFEVSLYQLEDFFVEVWYSGNHKMIERIEVTSTEDVLKNYDKNIDLSRLF